MKAIVWSKYHCPYCDQAKALLEAKGIKYEEKKIGDGYTKEDLLEFLEQLNNEHFEKIEEFFASMPRMSKKINMTCKKCGFQHELEAEGLESFFAF